MCFKVIGKKRNASRAKDDGIFQTDKKKKNPISVREHQVAKVIMKEYLAMMGGTCSPTLGYDGGMKWLLSCLSSAERRRRAKSDRSRSSVLFVSLVLSYLTFLLFVV